MGKNLSTRKKSVPHCGLTKWVKTCYVEAQFENILDGIINNSIVDLTRVQKFQFLPCIFLWIFKIHNETHFQTYPNSYIQIGKNVY
jgi:hypothetical protein